MLLVLLALWFKLFDITLGYDGETIDIKHFYFRNLSEYFFGKTGGNCYFCGVFRGVLPIN